MEIEAKLQTQGGQAFLISITTSNAFKYYDRIEALKLIPTTPGV